MNEFQRGDKVRIKDSSYLTVKSGTLGTVVDREEGDSARYKVLARNKNGKTITLRYRKEQLELIERPEEPRLPVGTIVVCTNRSQYHDRFGEIVKSNQYGNYPYVIHWEEDDKAGGGGSWSEAAFIVECGIASRIKEQPEPEPEPEVDERDEKIAQLIEENRILREAVDDAQWCFQYYADQHSAKQTQDGTYKARFNLMMAERMDNALETDS